MIFRFVSRLQNKSLYDHLLHWSIYVLLEKKVIKLKQGEHKVYDFFEYTDDVP